LKAFAPPKVALEYPFSLFSGVEHSGQDTIV
jgi:hypothetical protein